MSNSSNDNQQPSSNGATLDASGHAPAKTDSHLTDHIASDDHGDISIRDLVVVVLSYRTMILGMSFGSAVLAAILTLFIPNIYTAATKILPPAQSQSSALGMLSQLGLGSLGAVAGLRSPNDLYVSLLRSRAVSDKLIQKFGLREVFKAGNMTAARVALERTVKITLGARDSIITIEVTDKDPQRAADMANTYAEELFALTQTLAITEAARRRVFFEKQLELTNKKLVDAEVALKQVQEKTGLIRADSQSATIIQAIAAMRAQVSAKEMQIVGIKMFATEHNPDLVRAQRELAGLRAELEKMERDSTAKFGDIMFPASKVPEAQLEYTRKFREVKYQEALFELFSKQYEAAKIDEAKDATVIQVLDKAIPPEVKSGPQRKLTVILTGLLVGFFAILLAFIMDARSRHRRLAGERPSVAT